MFRAVGLAPKPVERLGEWKGRPLRAGASAGSTMRSFANEICPKLTTVANSTRSFIDNFTPSADRGILDQPDINDFALREQAPCKARPCARSEPFVPI